MGQAAPRHGVRRARASLAARKAGARWYLTLVSAVADGYIQLRALDRQLEIAQRTSQSLGEAARLQQVRFQEGAVPESDYRQAESQYETAAAQVPELERQVAQQENFINVLLAGIPAPSSGGEISTRCFSPVVPSALPASLLERRPDVRQAEQNLIAANADIGVAKAAYFPRISLTALFGRESAELSDLFKGPSRTWSYGAGVDATDLQRREDKQPGGAVGSRAAPGSICLSKIDHRCIPGRGKRAGRPHEVRPYA